MESYRLKREAVILGLSLVLLVFGLLLTGRSLAALPRLLGYGLLVTAYLISGWNVLVSALRGLTRGKVFNERFLMIVATAGAFAINQAAEAVAVMVFYKIGEILEEVSVARSRRSIQKTLDLRPDVARVRRAGTFFQVKPEEVSIGEDVDVRPGERIPLDGTVVEGSALVDISALTGEPVPARVEAGEKALAGSISTDGSLTIRVEKTANESSAAKIVELVQQASRAKAETERFITRFARFYTPVVVILALVIATVPPLLLAADGFRVWIYRALTLLVISCPCALVISVPLSYFAGIGGASRHGVLVKGARFLDVLSQVRTVVFDKTGTLTKGVFRVVGVHPAEDTTAGRLVEIAARAEARSNHPIAASIRTAYGRPVDDRDVTDCVEIGGQGVSARCDGQTVLVGNDRLMHEADIPHATCSAEGTLVHVAAGGHYRGYLVVGDELRDDARTAIDGLKDLGIDRIVLLTGDGVESARRVASSLGISEYFGDLLPADKVEHMERILRTARGGGRTAFVGDGINDAPVLARADVGIAMGGAGSDVAVETADVVLMTDHPSKISEALRWGTRTRRIVLQNIVFVLVAKAVFLCLGAVGVATMWEAVIADMGVALVAILNASRALR